MMYVKVDGEWEPCIPNSKDTNWKPSYYYVKKDDYWDVDVDIYPSPFDPILNPAAVTEPEFIGTATYLHTSSYYSHLPSSTYFNISSTVFKLNVYDGAEYKNAFVYKSGYSKAPSPWTYNPYSVYGGGSTSTQYAFRPWAMSANVQFNHVGFGISKQTKIKVDYTKATVTSVDIGPYSKNKKYNILNTSSFEIFNVEPYDKLYITVNNDLSTPLIVFADPLVDKVPNGAIYIKPGIINFSTLNSNIPGASGHRLDVSSNDLTYYLAPGAYIDGRFGLRDVSGVKFTGRGVINAYTQDDWFQKWSFLVPGVTDEQKLVYSPFMAFSSFSEASVELGKSCNHSIDGITIVNQFTYTNTSNFKTVDNCRVIAQVVNTDGWRVADYKSADPNKFASITRSFSFLGDDTFFPSEADCNILISGNYAISLAGATFRTYYPQYESNNNYACSAINNDVRTYASPSYQSTQTKPYSGYKFSVFGILSQSPKNRPWDTGNTYTLNNHVFSDIRIEGYTDIPIFDIGLEPSPGYSENYQESYPSISSLRFSNISASSHPFSKYKWTFSNAIFGHEEQFRPSNISFKNIRIDGNIITNNNKNNYISWTQKPKLFENNSTAVWGGDILLSYWGSSVADLYFIIGDSVADGYSGTAAELSSTIYSSIGNAYGSSSNIVNGAYIFQINPNFTNPGETGFPKFSQLRPGINTINIDYNNVPRPSDGDMGIESILAYKLRQSSEGRDIYILKMTRPNSLALSAQYAYGPATNQSWSISANDIFPKFITSAVNACKVLKNQYKNVDLKGGVIFLSNSLPDNISNTSSYIFSDLSGLVSGIRSVFYSGTGNGPNLDTYYSNIVWVGPLWEGGTGNYYNYFSSQLNTMDTNEIRFRLYPQIRGTEYSDSNYGVTHSNPKTKGYIKMAEDIYDIFMEMSRSYTNPDINPNVNINFTT